MHIKRNKNKGFTLIEIMIAVILIGIAIAAIVGANSSLTKLNGAAVELSTAEFLIEQIRERTAQLDFVSLKSLDEVTYSPAIDSQGSVLTDFSEYSQKLSAEYLNEADLTMVSGSTTNYIKISVDVIKNQRTVSSGSWIRANYK